MKKLKVNSADVLEFLSYLYINSSKSPLRFSLNKLSLAATAISKYAVGGILLYLSRTKIIQINRISYRVFELQWSMSKSCPTEAMAESVLGHLSELSLEFKFSSSELFPCPVGMTRVSVPEVSTRSVSLDAHSVVDLSNVKASLLVQELRRRGFIVSATLEL